MIITLTQLQWSALCSLLVDRMTDKDPQSTREWILATNNEKTDVDELLTVLMEAEENVYGHHS